MHLIYKPPSYWRIRFWSWVFAGEFMHLKILRSLVVTVGVCSKGLIIQVIMTPMGVLPNGKSCLRIKEDVTLVYVHAPIHSNSMYVQTVRRSIYNTIRPEHPPLPIRRYEISPQGPPYWPHYIHHQWLIQHLPNWKVSL